VSRTADPGHPHVGPNTVIGAASSTSDIPGGRSNTSIINTDHIPNISGAKRKIDTAFTAEIPRIGKKYEAVSDLKKQTKHRMKVCLVDIIYSYACIVV